MEESDEDTIEYSIEIVESSSSPASSIANDLSPSSSSSSIGQQEEEQQQEEVVATSEQQVDEEDNKTTRLDEEVFELIPESVDHSDGSAAQGETPRPEAEIESDSADRCEINLDEASGESNGEQPNGEGGETRTEEPPSVASESPEQTVQQSVIVVELGAEDEQVDSGEEVCAPEEVEVRQEEQPTQEVTPSIDDQPPEATIDDTTEQSEIPLDHQAEIPIGPEGQTCSIAAAETTTTKETTNGPTYDEIDLNQPEQVSHTSLPCHNQQEVPSSNNDDVSNNTLPIAPDGILPGTCEPSNTKCEPPNDENLVARQQPPPAAGSENQQVADATATCPAPPERSESPELFEDTLEGPVEQPPDAEIPSEQCNANEIKMPPPVVVVNEEDLVLEPIDVESEEQQCPADQAPYEDSLQEQVMAGHGEFVSTLWEPQDQSTGPEGNADNVQEKQWSNVPETVIASAPPLPSYLYLADEDLELEFDNEPVFEARNIEIELRVNPRSRYSLHDELGRGKFGTVYRCVELRSGKSFAAKFVHMRRREDREDVKREIEIMSLLQHKRLLQLFEAFDDSNSEMCLITELVEGGELFERIVNNDFELTEKKAAIFMRQICEGVQYMHGLNIVHLDMKPENILCVSRTGNRIKLIDFGLARQLREDEPLRVMFGTPDFAAPEVLAYDQVSLATDMWSVGVICYVLLSGLSPFMGDSDIDTMANVTRATYDFEDEAFEPISDLAKDFISRLLVKDQSERLRPGECLEHAWLQRGGIQLEASVRRRSSIRLMNPGDLDAIMASNAHRGSQMRLRAGAGSPAMTGDKAFRPPTLDTRNLKKYVVRRRWHRTVHAIMALQRMGAHLRF